MICSRNQQIQWKSTMLTEFAQVAMIVLFSPLIPNFLRSSRCFLRSLRRFLRSVFSFWGIRRLCTKVAFLIDFKRLCSKTIEINGVASFWSIRRASDVKSIEVQVLDRFEQFSIKSNSSWIMLDSCSKVQWVENKLQIQWGTIATMDMTVASKTGARNQTNAYGLHKLIIYPYEHMRFSRGAYAFGPAPQSLKTHRVWHVILHCTRVSTCETSWRVANKCIYIYGYIYTWLNACLLKGAFSPQPIWRMLCLPGGPAHGWPVLHLRNEYLLAMLFLDGGGQHLPSGISGSDVLQFFNAPSDDPYNNIENLAHYGDSLGAGPCRMSAH